MVRRHSTLKAPGHVCRAGDRESGLEKDARMGSTDRDRMLLRLAERSGIDVSHLEPAIATPLGLA